MLAIESDEEKSAQESDPKSTNSDHSNNFESNSPNNENPDDDQLAGATGATKELTLDAFSNSSNERGNSSNTEQQLQ